MPPEKMYRVMDTAGKSTGVHIWGHLMTSNGAYKIYRLDEFGIHHLVASTGLNNHYFQDSGLTSDASDVKIDS